MTALSDPIAPRMHLVSGRAIANTNDAGRASVTAVVAAFNLTDTALRQTTSREGLSLAITVRLRIDASPSLQGSAVPPYYRGCDQARRHQRRAYLGRLV